MRATVALNALNTLILEFPKEISTFEKKRFHRGKQTHFATKELCKAIYNKNMSNKFLILSKKFRKRPLSF